MIGGSSSMNAMLYVRGNRADYDGWEQNYGATGWSYDDVLPYFKRSEHNAEIRDSYHGTDGELHVSQKRWLSPHWERFMESAQAIGIERNPDYNGARQEGASLIQTTTKGGRRWSAADAFLRPVLKRSNLSVATKAVVRRVVIEGGRARRIEYEQKGQVARADADREVILAAGAYGSPQLLMLSGIGPADHLREVGVEPVVDEPSVGANLQEHPIAFVNWHCKDSSTLDDATDPRYAVQWLARRKGKLTSTVAEAFIHWHSEKGLAAPDFQIYFAPCYFWEHGFRKTGAPAITLACALQAPQSRGSVRLRSADPGNHPRIVNNLLSQDGEVEAMLRALELIGELASQPPLAGLLSERLNPGEGLRSKRELKDWLRATCEHLYHPACSCRIGPPGEGALGPDLKVHGVEGLRVCDASVMPRITSGNTNAPTYMIAERAAALMLGEAPASEQAVGVPGGALT
jgi:choline dehydrogenase-like flavoprotein